jgi:hypothetical protein
MAPLLLTVSTRLREFNATVLQYFAEDVQRSSPTIVEGGGHFWRNSLFFLAYL